MIGYVVQQYRRHVRAYQVGCRQRNGYDPNGDGCHECERIRLRPHNVRKKSFCEKCWSSKDSPYSGHHCCTATAELQIHRSPKIYTNSLINYLQFAQWLYDGAVTLHGKCGQCENGDTDGQILSEFGDTAKKSAPRPRFHRINERCERHTTDDDQQIGQRQ